MYRKTTYAMGALLMALGLGLATGPASAAPAATPPKPVPGAASFSTSYPVDKNPALHQAHETASEITSMTGATKQKATTKAPTTVHTLTPATDHQFSANIQNLADDATGVYADYTIHQPYLAQSATTNGRQNDVFTIANQLIYNPNGTSGSINVVEMGWNVEPVLDGGSLQTYLWAGPWANGNLLCYNLCGSNGWVHYVGTNHSPYNLGDNIQALVGTSTRLGEEHFDNTQCSGCAGWWITFGNQYVGYFPDSVWTSRGTSFTSVTVVQNFGEADVQFNESCTDMGNGQLGTSGSAATIGNQAFVGSTNAPNLGAFSVSGVPWAWNQSYNSTTKVMSYGGPGFTSDGQTSVTGTKDHCAPTAERTTSGFGSLLTNRQYCPDGASTTGCDGVLDEPYSGDVVNVIHVLPTAQQKIIAQAYGKYGVSGISYYLCDTSGCVSGHRVLVTNALRVDVQNAPGMRNMPTAFERAA